MGSNSIGPFPAPPGGYLLHMILFPVDLPNTKDTLDPYPVGYRISGHPMNWKDTRRAEYHMNWIPPAKGATGVALAWRELSS